MARDLTCSFELPLLSPRLFAVLLLPSPLLLQTGQMPFSGSFSVRVVPSTSLEGTRSEGWETSISGSSHSGISSLEDAQSRRDLEVLKYCHDIASVISEEALESIRECYSIPEGYVLQAPLLKQRPYQPRPSEISISVNALEAGAMDLNVLRKKLGMPGGKSAPAVGPEGAQPEVEVIHTEASAKQPVGSLIADQATVGRPGKWVKIAVRKHKSHRELEKLKSERDPEQLVRARQRVDELEADNAKLRSGLDELSGRLEEVDKELNKL
ncbi:hypothetical protein BHM03_00016259 [Ensete ventricosum]|nr:hypothetical protein BHM03_00016259 [Ensete ventricosum]